MRERFKAWLAKAFGVHGLARESFRSSGCRVQRSAFTLMELIVVIAIILFLAGFVIGVARYASIKKNESIAKAEVKVMELSLREYRNDKGAFPACDNSNTNMAMSDAIFNSTNLFRALSGNSAGTALIPDAGSKAYFTAFRDVRQGNLRKTNDIYYVVDPWSHAYNYIQPGLTNKVTFDLGSAGSDGMFGTADDIWNWNY